MSAMGDEVEEDKRGQLPQDLEMCEGRRQRISLLAIQPPAAPPPSPSSFLLPSLLRTKQAKPIGRSIDRSPSEIDRSPGVYFPWGATARRVRGPPPRPPSAACAATTASCRSCSAAPPAPSAPSTRMYPISLFCSRICVIRRTDFGLLAWIFLGTEIARLISNDRFVK